MRGFVVPAVATLLITGACADAPAGTPRSTAGSTAGSTAPAPPASSVPPGEPAVLDSVTLPADLGDGRLTTVRVRTRAPLLEVVAVDPPGVRTRYVSWQRCPERCDITGPYDVEARRLLAQALPPRYPVPAGTVSLVLAVRVDRTLGGCVEVPALDLRLDGGGTGVPGGSPRRVTGPGGGPVLRVC